MKVSDLELVAQGRLSLAEQEIRKARAELASKEHWKAISYIESAIFELEAAREAVRAAEDERLTHGENKPDGPEDPFKPR